MSRRLTLIGALLAIPLSPFALGAQGWIEPDGPVQLHIRSPIVRVSSAIRATVDGRVARFEVEERFHNAGGGLAEGLYLYPLPGEAVFTEFSPFQGDRELKGEMMNAEQARQIYEEIVRRKRDPALLTLAGHGLIRAQVFPIQPGETRTVILRFTQLLTRDGDALRLRYALGARGDSAQTSLRVRVRGANQWGTPYSPTHQLTTAEDSGDLRVTLTGLSTGDVQLFLPLRRGLLGGSVVAHAPVGEDGYYLLLLAPPATGEETAMRRDLTLVVDVSGSMSGEKLEQAKAALQQALGSLRRGDRFRVIAFSTAVRPFREGFVEATSENLAAARQFVAGLEANGGTNIAGALEAALTTPTGESAGNLPLLLFPPGGAALGGGPAAERIATLAGARIGRTRLFSVGIGYDVNTYLLDRLAVEGRGSAEYIPPGANVETAVGQVLAKLSHPALANLRVVEAPVRLLESSPVALPDLFYGEELVVLGRYQGSGSGDVVLEGERNGRVERFRVPATFAGSATNDFIPPLWAARRIGDLTRQIRLEGSTPELVARVRELGLRYGILTEYTSYLVQEPNVVAGPVPLPRTEPQSATRIRGMTGQQAVEEARASVRLQKTATLNAADDAAKDRLDEMKLVSRQRTGAGKEVRRIGGRLFAERDGVWTDLAHGDSLKVVAVAPYTSAYFELLHALPELARPLSASETILVAGKHASLRVAPAGITAWRPGELDRFVREFRG